MMFSNNFVVSIHDSGNNVLRENRGKEVFLPFNSEYKIRLRNNHSRKAVAEVSIDGTRVLGPNKIIVEANSFVDLERFCIDGDLKNGSRFKFVKAGENDPHPDVQDPTSPDNGSVRVKFWLEVPDRIGFFCNDLVMKNEYAHSEPKPSPFKFHPDTVINVDGDVTIYNGGSNIGFSGTGGYSGFSGFSGIGGCSIGIGTSSPDQIIGCSSITQGSLTSASNSFGKRIGDNETITTHHSFSFYSPLHTPGNLEIPEEKGATVEGGQSSQSFRYQDIGDLEDSFTEIRLTIKPFKQPITVKKTKRKYCQDCGFKNKYSAKFCMNCGKNFNEMGEI